MGLAKVNWLILFIIIVLRILSGSNCTQWCWPLTIVHASMYMCCFEQCWPFTIYPCIGHFSTLAVFSSVIPYQFKPQVLDVLTTSADIAQNICPLKMRSPTLFMTCHTHYWSHCVILCIIGCNWPEPHLHGLWGVSCAHNTGGWLEFLRLPLSQIGTRNSVFPDSMGKERISLVRRVLDIKHIGVPVCSAGCRYLAVLPQLLYGQ